MDAPIYLDHNATTTLCPEAREAMLPYLGEAFGNASSVHRRGQHARASVERARAEVAALLSVPDPSRIVFTSGGTEALNLALRGVALGTPGITIVASAVEHHAVVHTVQDLALGGVPVAFAPVDGEGVLDLARFEELLQQRTLAVVMHGNNEVGTIEPVAEAARAVKRRGGVILVDAVQSAGRLPIEPEAWGADLVVVSAHKMGGPQGAAALWVRPGVPLRPILTGGPQERSRRGGTENVAAIAGFGAAARVARTSLSASATRMAALRDLLEEAIVAVVPRARILAREVPRVPNTSCILFPGAPGDALVCALDLAGISASTGAACASGSTEPSHVVAAMGVPEAERKSSVRFSVGALTTDDEIRRAAAIIPEVVGRVRRAEADGEAAARPSGGSEKVEHDP